MRKIVLALGLVCLLATPAWAEGEFSLFGAYEQVTGNNASSIGGGARVSLSLNTVSFDLTATWLPQKGNVGVLGGSVDKVQITPVDLGLRFRFARGSEFRPYVGVGLSYILTDLEFGEADDELGYYLSLGFVGMANGPVRWYSEVLYRTAEITADFGVQGKVEEDVGGFGIAAGLTFAF
jgi:outer membrane protein W